MSFSLFKLWLSPTSIHGILFSSEFRILSFILLLSFMRSISSEIGHAINLFRESRKVFVASLLIPILDNVVHGRIKSPLLYIQMSLALLIAMLTCSNVFAITLLLIGPNKLLSGMKYCGQFFAFRHFRKQCSKSKILGTISSFENCSDLTFSQYQRNIVLMW